MRTQRQVRLFICGVWLTVFAGCATPPAGPPEPPLPTQATGLVYPAEELARPPQRIPNSYVALPWPELLRDRRPQGAVAVDYVVGKDGRVIAAHVVRATFPELGAAALREVAQWKFLPGEKDGQPVQAEARWRIEYSSSGNTQWLSR
ncbi:MAG: energy transducer TonB [Opitutae bacterium]|nr:energy transducer TonB [Opitutae bacterium]